MAVVGIAMHCQDAENNGDSPKGKPLFLSTAHGPCMTTKLRVFQQTANEVERNVPYSSGL